NKGNTSATGVAFSRDAATGENIQYGDYLVNAQGEDVVAGIRVTQSLTNMKNEMPELAEQLFGILITLEKHYKDMC
ncbi:PEP/pyruvate-binding domain-containing protein, partial [Candidatus Aquicultor secundus]